MSRPLHLLLVEDDPADAALVQRALQQAGFTLHSERVDSEADFLRCLDPSLDVILCDYSLPQFSALAALDLLHQRRLDIPFIVVSGTIGDEIAVETMKRGAADYLLKDRLGRLGQAIEQAIERRRDRAARRLAEMAMAESQQRFNQLATAIQEVFWLADPHTRQVFYVSPAYEEIWGRSCKSLYEAPGAFAEAIHPDDRQRTSEALDRQSAGGRYQQEYRIVRPDGTVRWIRDRSFPIFDASGALDRVAGIAEDITATKELENRFLQAQKMEAVGQLAGGVAHDFNNLLTAILGYGEILLSSLDSSDPRREQVDEILSAGDRAAGLTRQLLAFSRQQLLEPRVFELNDVVTDIKKMVLRLIGEHIELRGMLSPRSTRVKADPGQIEQVIMNLAVNARDAMPGGGALTLETARISVHDAEREVPPGEYVALTVRDTGCGMTDEVKAHIFEPFFTTKERGKGTGLGLATSFGIVKQSGGYIVVSSEHNRGTAFTIYLPSVEATLSAPPSVRPATQQPGGTESILLVEDEASLRRLTALVLRRLGYTVLEAANGEEGLRLGADPSHRISLVITDVVMPKMDGQSMCEQIRAAGASPRFLFCSGYTNDAIVHHGVLESHIAFLQKPYTPMTLALKVREVLDTVRESV